MTHLTRPADHYSPLYFLASLGAGGTAVTFFLWLYFWVPHPGQSVPVFEDISAALASGPLLQKAMIVAAMAGILFFAYHNIRLLIWNLRQLSGFKKTDAYRALSASNAQTQMMTLPLALAMSVNVAFILGLVFVPGLSVIMEYMFPAALVAFAAIGFLAFRQLGEFITRAIASGGFDCSANNSFAQLMPAFTIAVCPLLTDLKTQRSD